MGRLTFAALVCLQGQVDELFSEKSVAPQSGDIFRVAHMQLSTRTSKELHLLLVAVHLAIALLPGAPPLSAEAAQFQQNCSLLLQSLQAQGCSPCRRQSTCAGSRPRSTFPYRRYRARQLKFEDSVQVIYRRCAELMTLNSKTGQMHICAQSKF